MVAVELPHSTGEPVHDTYDAHGDRLTKTVTDGTDTRTWAYRYNDLGLLTQIGGPRTGVSNVTRLAYDAQGELASVTNALDQICRVTASDPDGLRRIATTPWDCAPRSAPEARRPSTTTTSGGGS